MLHDILNKTYSDIELEQIQNGVVSSFIATDNNYIKIGKSTYKSLPSRLSSLQTGNHRILELIGILDGVKYSEAKLHKLFEKDRVRGEWFTYSEEIKQYLNSIKTSQLIKSKDSDDMVSLPIKLDRLAKLSHSGILLEVSVEIIDDLINGGPESKIKDERTLFKNLTNHLTDQLKITTIDNLCWGKYAAEVTDKRRIKIIELIVFYYKVNHKILTSYNDVKEYLELFWGNIETYKLEIQSKFKVGETYSRKEVKQYLSNLYKLHGVKRKVSHRDLFEYFDLKEKKINGYFSMTVLSKK